MNSFHISDANDLVLWRSWTMMYEQVWSRKQQLMKGVLKSRVAPFLV